MCLWRVLRVTTYVLVVMVSLTATQEFVDKKAPEGQQWFLGSRFGRSNGGTSAGQQSSSRRLVVTPRRDDKFHPGSRYGKRTHSFAIPIARTSQTDTFTSLISTTAAEKSQNVQCSYTGVADLYRCHVRKENSSDEFLSK